MTRRKRQVETPQVPEAPDPEVEQPFPMHERMFFLDAAAISRFGSGYPAQHCYREALQLWKARQEFLAAEERKR